MKLHHLFESQGYHVKNHSVYGKILAFDGQTVIADYDKASRLADKYNGSLIKSMDGRRYIIKLSEAPPTEVKETDASDQNAVIDNLVQQMSDLHAEMDSLKKSQEKISPKERLIREPFNNPVAVLRRRLDRMSNPVQGKIDLLMKKIANHQGIDVELLHKMWVDKYNKTPDEYCGCEKVEEKREVWDKPNPVKNHKKLSPAKKAAAKRRASAAGRPYPNMVDNIWAARK
jgi:hypothetical protein